MKKTYIEPMTKTVALRYNNQLCAGSLNGDGVNMKINNSSVKGAEADSRGAIDWDDDEE